MLSKRCRSNIILASLLLRIVDSGLIVGVETRFLAISTTSITLPSPRHMSRMGQHLLSNTEVARAVAFSAKTGLSDEDFSKKRVVDVWWSRMTVGDVVVEEQTFAEVTQEPGSCMAGNILSLIVYGFISSNIAISLSTSTTSSISITEIYMLTLGSTMNFFQKILLCWFFIFERLFSQESPLSLPNSTASWVLPRTI